VTGSSDKKSIARSVGEFVGHIVEGVKADPSEDRTAEVRRTIEETTQDGVVLRRTTIEEVEFRDASDARPSAREQTPASETETPTS
jgi:hypothetical protein